jgi:hypothetical protein
MLSISGFFPSCCCFNLILVPTCVSLRCFFLNELSLRCLDVTVSCDVWLTNAASSCLFL